MMIQSINSQSFGMPWKKDGQQEYRKALIFWHRDDKSEWDKCAEADQWIRNNTPAHEVTTYINPLLETEIIVKDMYADGKDSIKTFTAPRNKPISKAFDEAIDYLKQSYDKK